MATPRLQTYRVQDIRAGTWAAPRRSSSISADKYGAKLPGDGHGRGNKQIKKLSAACKSGYCSRCTSLKCQCKKCHAVV